MRTMLETHRPRRLAVFSRDELKQHEMKEQFQSRAGNTELRFFLGDVRDRDRLYRAFAGVDVVVHAAALKQVPATEADPFEAVQTNVIGSKNVVDAAIDAGVSRVIALSTDKATNPVNLYGATKLVAEKLFVQGNAYSGSAATKFSCVRYGNVMGSRGSVIPIFLAQRSSGEVTVTDKRMTRFWITLEQAVEFVVNSLGRMQGGEVFVPKIPSMSVIDVVNAIAPDCKVKITGIRPGEKIHELLLSEDETRHSVEFDDYYVIKPEFQAWETDGWVKGRPLPEGFRYASDTASGRLSVSGLRKAVEELNI